jgi:V8-like Glu-specific endopeptidase
MTDTGLSNALILTSAFLTAACGSTDLAISASRSQQHPITHGTPANDDQGVVALMREGEVACTGTLASQRVVVTAAHCMSVAHSISIGSSAGASQQRIDVAFARAHPDFKPLTLENDIGVLVLAEAAPSHAKPTPLMTTALDESWVGSDVRIVGFGLDLNGVAGEKREGWATIEAIERTAFTLTASPSQTCQGDSGGPAFARVNGAEILVGVTSSGDPACRESARMTLVSRFAADFVQPYLDRTVEGSGKLGDRCYYEQNCAQGSCIAAADDPDIRYCSSTCDDDADCPLSMRCSDDSDGTWWCRTPIPTPGAFGATCGTTLECESALCARGKGDTTARCSRRCFSAVPGSCPVGTECLETDPGLQACLPSPEPTVKKRSGCTQAPANVYVFLALLLACVKSARAKRVKKIEKIERK